LTTSGTSSSQEESSIKVKLHHKQPQNIS
ncbi:unnamed protein product, partial [Rotaria sp. Silwood2]